MCYMNVSYDEEQRADERERETEGRTEEEKNKTKKEGGGGVLAVFAISPSQRLNLAISL